MASPKLPVKKVAVSASKAKRLAAMLKAKKGGKMTAPKSMAPTKIVPPGMDAEDIADKGVDEDKEDS